MAHGARHPAHCCKWIKGSQQQEWPLRTFEGNREENQKWIAAGANPAKLKDHFNCRSPPMEFFPKEGAIDDAIAPSSLHIVIGLTNHMYNEMIEAFPGGKAWAERLHLTQSEYFAGTWEGRPCKKLLANVNVLQEVIEEDQGPRRARRSATAEDLVEAHVAQPYANAFAAFNLVLDRCFGADLKDGWEDSLIDFEDKYLRTG